MDLFWWSQIAASKQLALSKSRTSIYQRESTNRSKNIIKASIKLAILKFLRNTSLVKSRKTVNTIASISRASRTLPSSELISTALKFRRTRKPIKYAPKIGIWKVTATIKQRRGNRTTTNWNFTRNSWLKKTRSSNWVVFSFKKNCNLVSSKCHRGRNGLGLK